MPTPLGNFFVKTLLNSPLHPLLGENFAIITVTGRKTGRPITTPVNTLRVDGILTVVSMRTRTWWRNLRDGQIAQLRRAGKRFPVRGEVVGAPDEILSNLTKYFAQYPGYAKYFDVHQNADGKPDSIDLERLARERVIIHLFPV